MTSFDWIAALILIGVISKGSHALNYVESSHLPIQLQCRCPFLTVIQVSGITLKNFAGQYSPAENVFPGIEVAAETECRQQMPNDLRKCDLYLTPYDVSAHSTEIVILYNCLANESVLNSSFSENAGDVRLSCPSQEHSIEIKEVQLENGQAPISVLIANQNCSEEVSFQKMLNFSPPYECSVERGGRHGCILVNYECQKLADTGGQPVFPTPWFDG